MSDDETVEVSRETLGVLYNFARHHTNEYGGLRERHAVMDAGVALGESDPTPKWDISDDDLQHLQDRGVYTEAEVNEYTERVERLSGDDR